jgi:hypothetical protein
MAVAQESQVVRLSLRSWVLAAIRGSLSAVGLVASVLDGASPDKALLAWVVGAILVSIVLAGDPQRRRSAPAEPLPGRAVPESWTQIARTDVMPSTVGVTVLTIVALLYNPILAGLLAGILGGMAFMTLVARVQVALEERKLGGALYLERQSRRLYLEARP